MSLMGQPRISSIALTFACSDSLDLRLLDPLVEGHRAHEVDCSHDAVTHTQQVGSRLAVLEVDELVDCRREASEELLVHEIRNEVVASEGEPLTSGSQSGVRA